MFGYDDLLGGMADFNVENKVTPKSIPHTEDFKMPPQANADCKNMDITYITADIRPEKGAMNQCPVFLSIDPQTNAKIISAYISGPIGEVNNYVDLIDVLLTATSEDVIRIYIDSPGGMIASGGLVASAIDHCAGKVYTIARGLCASAAALIHSAAKPEYTSVSPLAVMLYHMSSHADSGVSTGIKGRAQNQVKYVNETLLKKARADHHITDEEFARIQAGEDIIVPAVEWMKRTGKGSEE